MKVTDFKNGEYHKGLTDEQKQMLANLTDEQLTLVGVIAGNRINKVNGEIYQNIETTVTALTGVEKQEGQKAIDHMRHALGEVKKKGGNAELQAKYDKIVEEKQALEQQIKDGKGSEALSARIKELEEKEAGYLQKIEGLKTDHKAELDKVNGEHLGFKKQTMLAGMIPALKVEDQNYASYLKQEGINKAMNELEIDVQDNKLVAKKDLELVNLNDYFAEVFKPHIDTTTPVGGAGGGKGGGTPPANPNLIDFTAAKTYTQGLDAIEKGLEGKGLKEGTEDYNKAYDENVAALDAENLPLEDYE
jgi:hypothetical protein